VGGGSTGPVGDAGNAGVGEGAAQQGADSGGFGGVSVNDLQTACGGPRARGRGPTFEGRDGFGNLGGRLRVQMGCEGTRTAATWSHTDVRMSATFARVRASRGTRTWRGDD